MVEGRGGGEAATQPTGGVRSAGAQVMDQPRNVRIQALQNEKKRKEQAGQQASKPDRPP